MRPEIDLPGYETPFYLFGNARPCAARSLDALVLAGIVPAGAVPRLIEVARSDGSLAIVAPGSRIGKSSLLAALLPYSPPGLRTIHLRGSFETFGFARRPDWRPEHALLIANEVSDHLPVYLPPDRFAVAAGLVAQGARLWCTAHARDLTELRRAWPAWPDRAPLTVVALDPGGACRIERWPTGHADQA